MAGLRTSWESIGLGKGCWGQNSVGAAIPLAIGSLPASGWCELCLSGRSLLVLGKGSAGRPGMYLATFIFCEIPVFPVEFEFMLMQWLFICFCNLMESKFNENF